jgi:hypothetical protein
MTCQVIKNAREKLKGMFDGTGEKNAYVCENLECNSYIVTIDREQGVTQLR